MSSVSSLDPGALAALARKYRTLAALRSARARGEPPPSREAFRALAREFPGALRELDTVRFGELIARAAALEAAAAAAAASSPARATEPLAPWILYMHGYHAWMRVALALKPRLSRLQASPDDPTAARLAAEAARGSGLAVDPDFVHQVATPPAGRLRSVVLARVALQYGSTPDAVREVLFPPRTGEPDDDTLAAG